MGMTRQLPLAVAFATIGQPRDASAIGRLCEAGPRCRLYCRAFSGIDFTLPARKLEGAIDHSLPGSRIVRLFIRYFI